MRKAELPFLADWFAISLRWLALLALTASQALSAKVDIRFVIVIGTAALWNCFITLLAINNQRLDRHRMINVGLDVLASLALFYFSGGLSGSTAWCGVLAILSAAVYFEWRGSLLTSLLMSITEALVVLLSGGIYSAQAFFLPLGFLTTLNFCAGAALGLLALPLMRVVRRRYHTAALQIREAERKTQLQEQLLELQDEARKQLARELHDGPTQSISALAVQISIARRMLADNPVGAAEELERTEELARKTTEEMRHMLFTLRPLALESQGLMAALQAMSDKMRSTYQQNVLLEIDPLVIDNLDTSKQTVVFYLAEEAVNNARKHAEAAEITIRFNFQAQDKTLALLEITDNGKGFDIDRVSASYDRRGSLGLINLQERAALINAALSINSTPGQGTRVTALIPLNHNVAGWKQRQLAFQTKPQ